MQTSKNSKHLGSFWPLVFIFVVTALLAGVIIGSAYGNILQDNIDSLTFRATGSPSHHGHTNPASIKAVSTAPKASGQ